MSDPAHPFTTPFWRPAPSNIRPILQSAARDTWLVVPKEAQYMVLVLAHSICGFLSMQYLETSSVTPACDTFSTVVARRQTHDDVNHTHYPRASHHGWNLKAWRNTDTADVIFLFCAMQKRINSGATEPQQLSQQLGKRPLCHQQISASGDSDAN